MSTTQQPATKPRRRRRSAPTPRPAPDRLWTCGRPDDYLPPWLVVRLDDDAEIAFSTRAISRAGQCSACTVERMIGEGLFWPDPELQSDAIALRMRAQYRFRSDETGAYSGVELSALVWTIACRRHPQICIHDHEAGCC